LAHDLQGLRMGMSLMGMRVYKRVTPELCAVWRLARSLKPCLDFPLVFREIAPDHWQIKRRQDRGIRLAF